MIKFVTENGRGITEDEAVAIRFSELENEGNLNKLIPLKEAVDKSIPVVVWSHDDGDGNELCLEAHHHGFLISLNGDNYLKEELKAQDQAYVSTWLSFEMLDEIKKAMETYGHLVDGNGHFEQGGKELDQ